MSPEQARGKSVDKRADVWAFGCVLMRDAGRHAPFAGDDVSQTMARVIEREPDWRRISRRRRSSASFDAAFRKDVRQRFRDIGACASSSSTPSVQPERRDAVGRRPAFGALDCAVLGGRTGPRRHRDRAGRAISCGGRRRCRPRAPRV